MKKPEAKDSDLIKLVRQFEQRRLKRKKQHEELERIAAELDKVERYYRAEVKKYEEQKAAVWREASITGAHLNGISELLKPLGLVPPNSGY